MSLEVDEEILQDFLVEAGEILELLSEQLVDLEQRPEDKDLLNAIFRGFHTVKGGAGFLQLTALVDCCHVAENVFDVLRNGKRHVTSELMDIVLQSLDTVNAMFDQVRNGQEPDHASPELLEALGRLAEPETAQEAANAEPPLASLEEEFAAAQEDEVVEETSDISDDEFENLLQAISSEDASALAAEQSSGDDDLITDDEFENLLDELHGTGSGPSAGDTSAAEPTRTPTTQELLGDADPNGDITDEEFEALLDQLQGGGAAPAAAEPPKPKEPEKKSPAPVSAGNDGDLITDDEFERLMDELQAQNKGAFAHQDEAPVSAPAAQKPTGVTKAPETPSAKATEKPTPKPATPPKPPAPVEPPKAAPAAEPVAAKAADKAAPANAAAAETTVRVDTKRLDDIMNMVGELVLVRNRLVRLGSKHIDDELVKAVASLDVVTGDLQTSVMKTRMQPIKKVFGRFPRVVRDLSRSLKKEVHLELVGEETDLDKNLVEALADPLIHLVRNAVDHGIENPEVREGAGKPRAGTVILSAQQEGDHILLSIDDDGAGMDPHILRAKAVEKGVLDADSAERLSDSEAFNLIFAPGFSTKSEISDVSGRGVGMDVVKTKITQLNGSLNVRSIKGKGSRIEIKVPLTLAIMPTLMIMLDDQAFALPLVNVNEIFNLDLSKTNVVDGQEVVVVREKPLPLFYLHRWLVSRHRNDQESKSGHVVIVSIGTQRVGFVVDQLVGQEEVVIKPLGKMLHGTPGISGATITGDGRIALILDIPSLLKYYASR
ncbi:chemotaxis protein CheW [Pokkaliibacter sp. CJK22405]|uniref:chemotaxis protein CheW n=1 Tax=Pokkaliibacter sp. CJK22405 TaxID=3384615 RepID=UPI00398528D0